jgi:hypothetical protein
VNNPTSAEIGLALENGSVGCTTNPAFVGGLLKKAPEEVLPVIADVVASEADDVRAAEIVQERVVETILPRFATLSEQPGPFGLVSLQGAPERDADVMAIVAQARRSRSLGSNCVPKIAATAPGLEAFEVLVTEGQPTVVTEVFSLGQIIETCERYLATAERTGVRPPFVIAPITGIFGDHLRAVARRDEIEMPPDLLDLAGVIFGRAAARLVRERAYPVTLLFGGARTMVDLTGLIGDGHHATVNWSTFAEVLRSNPSVRSTIRDAVPDRAIRLLTSSFDAMRRALSEDGLALEEFEDFGPVQHFRDNFVAGWSVLLEAVGAARLQRSGVRA